MYSYLFTLAASAYVLAQASTETLLGIFIVCLLAQIWPRSAT